MTINSVLQGNVVSSTTNVVFADRTADDNISSAKNDPAAIVQISEEAKETLSKAGQPPKALDPANFSIRVDPQYFLKPEYSAEVRKLLKVVPTLESLQYLRPQLKPPYFRDAYEYNSEISKKEAERIVAEAEKKGITLNFDVTFDCFKSCNGICEPLPKGVDIFAVGHTIEDALSDNEKAMLEQMYNYTVEHNLPTNQIMEIAKDIESKKSIAHYLKSNNIKLDGTDFFGKDFSNAYISGSKDLKLNEMDFLTKDYLTDLVSMVKDGYETHRFNFSALDILLKNFDKFEQAVKDEMETGRA
jgi:hypothetical protein